MNEWVEGGTWVCCFALLHTLYVLAVLFHLKPEDRARILYYTLELCFFFLLFFFGPFCC